MISGVVGYESVDAVLRRRGHLPTAKGDIRDILLPLDGERVLSGEECGQYLELFGKASFRKVARKLIAARGRPVQMEKLEKIAGNEASSYAEFLISLGIADRVADGIRLTRLVDNIGPSLEWYVAELCKRELCGSAEWSVRLEGLPIGGDYDVLAWLAPTLVYIELKSSAASKVSESELKHFLQRGEELAPDMAVLLIDTSDDLTGLLDRLNEVMLPVVRVASGIRDPGWRPDKPFIHPREGFPGVCFGYRRVYVTNSTPSILAQLRRCLRYYHAHVRGKAFCGGPPVNFVTGYVGEEP